MRHSFGCATTPQGLGYESALRGGQDRRETLQTRTSPSRVRSRLCVFGVPMSAEGFVEQVRAASGDGWAPAAPSFTKNLRVSSRWAASRCQLHLTQCTEKNELEAMR
jgi:hypothetical protein